ncbi:MAG TPA: TraB/GumN family protein, partial [Brevundimonas sp.]
MKYIGALLPVLVLLSGLAFAPVVAAQDTTPAPEAATALEDVVVTARRSGAPMWEVRRGDSTVLLVGEIRGVPAATPWRPDALEAATLRADRVFSGMRVQASFSDLFRLIWRSRTFVSLPEGKTTADYLPPEWQVRLSALEVRYDQDYSRRSFLISSEDLLTDRLRFDRATT